MLHTRPDDPVVVMITSPVEPEHIERIAEVDPGRLEVIYRPDLLPPTRYVADHHGPPDWPGFAARRAEWRSLLRRAEILWDFPTTEQEPLYDLCPRLRWVQTTSAGVGPMVKQFGVEESELLVTTASGIHGKPLAEFVFAALLFSAKRFAHLQAQQRSRRWVRFCGGGLEGQTLAIVGPGRIGQEIGRIGRAFGMTIWAMGTSHSRTQAAELGVDRLFAREEFLQMLSGADALVLCCPHTPETEGLVGAAEIDVLKSGVVFVNIARGAVVDESALIAALQTGRIGFAALDVFQNEPLAADSPLWDLPNVLINPHSASTVASENAKIADIFIRNLHCYLSERFEEMAPQLDKRRGY